VVSAPSCGWRLEVAVCADGIRFLVNGRRVGAAEFEVHLADVRQMARPIVADTLAVLRETGGVTSAELAEARGLQLNTASERLRQLFSLGIAKRTPEGRNSYRYTVAC
jgi:DNA-binding transcriptional ArsR family regulator